MVRKDYLVKSGNSKDAGSGQDPEQVKREIMNILDTAFAAGALVEVKIIESIDLDNNSKHFSKLRFDIISNTDFERFN